MVVAICTIECKIVLIIVINALGHYSMPTLLVRSAIISHPLTNMLQLHEIFYAGKLQIIASPLDKAI